MKALFEVFYQPGKLFASLPERNYAWIAPLLFNSLIGVLSWWLVMHYMGAENLARQQMQMYASRMSPDQMQAAIARAGSPAQMYTGLAASFAGVAVMMLVVSGALMAFAMMTSKAPRFGSMLAAVSLAYFPYFVAATLMSGLVLAISPDPASLDFRNLLATNVGAFMNREETSKGLYAAMSSVDILSFAEIILLALGFSKLTKSKFGFGLGAVLALWVVYVMAKMGLASIF
jgi:hypothetical protein